MPGDLFGSPRQETRQQSTTRPLAESQPLLGGILNGLSSAYNLGSNALSGVGNAIVGSANAAPATLPSGKQALLNGGATGGGFDFGLSPEEAGYYDALRGNAANAGRYGPQIGGLADDLFRGGTDNRGAITGNLNEYRAGLLPFTTASTNPFDDPTFAAMLDNIKSDAFDRVRSTNTFPGLGTYGSDVGEGVTRAALPVAVAERARLEAQKRGAIDAVYGAGNTSAGLLSNEEQRLFGNRLTAPQIGQAALAAENAPYQQGISLAEQLWAAPARRAATLSAVPFAAAQLGRSTDGTSTTETHTPIGQQLLGAGLLGASLFTGGGPMAGLLGGMGSAAANPGGFFMPSRAFWER